MHVVLLAKTTTTMLKRPGVGVVLVVILTVAMTNTKITFQRLSGLESTLKKSDETIFFYSCVPIITLEETSI